MARKVDVDVADFSSALKFLGEFADPKDGVLRFVGPVAQVSSLEVGAECRVPVDLGDVAVPAARLAAAVSAAEAQGAGSMSLQVTESNLTWRAGGASGRIALVAESQDMFPPPGERVATVKADARFRLALELAGLFMARDFRWPMLRGVYFGSDGALLASDGARLFSVRAAESGLGCTLPEPLLCAAEGWEFSDLSLTDRDVWVEGGDRRAFGRLYQQEYPYQRFAGVLSDLTCRAESGELPGFRLTGAKTSALLRSLVAATEAPTHALRVRTRPDYVDVWCEREDGEVRVRFDAETSGPETEFRVDGKMLVHAVNRLGCPFWVTESALFGADGAVRVAVMLLVG